MGNSKNAVQTNFIVNGNGKTENSQLIQLGFDATAATHKYEIVADNNSIQWLVDDKLIRKVNVGNILSKGQYIYYSLWVIYIKRNFYAFVNILIYIRMLAQVHSTITGLEKLIGITTIFNIILNLFKSVLILFIKYLFFFVI